MNPELASKLWWQCASSELPHRLSFFAGVVQDRGLPQCVDSFPTGDLLAENKQCAEFLREWADALEVTR